MKFTVGQDVLIVRTGYGAAVRDPIPAKVVKVGRTLVTVERPGKYGCTEVYRMDTGALNGPYGGSRIVTAEQFADEQRVKALVGPLRKHGVDVYRANLSADQLAAILAIVTQVPAS